MPRFDFKCEEGHITQDVTIGGYLNEDRKAGHIGFKCPICGKEASRLPAAPSFVVNGYNAKNGYRK